MNELFRLFSGRKLGDLFVRVVWFAVSTMEELISVIELNSMLLYEQGAANNGGN
jgi:hypothetical protein